MSAITYAELEYRVAVSANPQRERKNLIALIEDIPVAPFNATAVTTCGSIREATGERKKDQLEKLIAAHAVALSGVLVTNNVRDFVAYPGLRIENWLDEA